MANKISKNDVISKYGDVIIYDLNYIENDNNFEWFDFYVYDAWTQSDDTEWCLTYLRNFIDDLIEYMIKVTYNEYSCYQDVSNELILYFVKDEIKNKDWWG